MSNNSKLGLLLEYNGKYLTAASKELLTAASGLGEICSAFAVNTAAAKDLDSLNAKRVYYTPQPVLAVDLATAINEVWDFDIFLTPMTLLGRETGAYLSHLQQTEFYGGIDSIVPTETGWHLSRLINLGLAQETCLVCHKPLVVGVVTGSFGVAPQLSGAPELIQLAYTPSLAFQEYLADRSEIRVQEAERVVAGGSGMVDQAGFGLLEDLSIALDAPLGGSRVAEDKGWIEHDAMIGATGQTIAPGVYIACGISGAIQHMVGIDGAKRIVAINHDPMCSMMTNSDLAVVGDSKEIVAALIKELADYGPKQEV